MIEKGEINMEIIPEHKNIIKNIVKGICENNKELMIDCYNELKQEPLFYVFLIVRAFNDTKGVSGLYKTYWDTIREEDSSMLLLNDVVSKIKCDGKYGKKYNSTPASYIFNSPDGKLSEVLKLYSDYFKDEFSKYQEELL